MNLKDAGIICHEGKLLIEFGPGRDPYKGRMYEFNGELGCSVSTAMSCFQELGLQDWKQRNSEKKILEVSGAAKEEGTARHADIERQANGEEPQKKDAWFENWEEVREKYQITAEMTEVSVFSPKYLYGGRIDRIGMFDGRRSIIDLKTGRFHFSDLWKTEAYRRAYIELTGDAEVGAVVLYVPRQGGKARHYTVERHDVCFLAFLSTYYGFRMTYYKDLIKAGMSERVFEPIPAIFGKEMK